MATSLPASSLSNAPKGSPRSLSGLLPFLRPYWGRIAAAVFFLVMAAIATLIFPLALRSLIDGGLVSCAPIFSSCLVWPPRWGFFLPGVFTW
jgi:ABC-type multidrug transport system fused ATPase/permease subunit